MADNTKAAYRAAAPDPWGREQVEGLVRAAREASHWFAANPYKGSGGVDRPLGAALRPFATIAEQDGPIPVSTPWPGEAPAAGAPAPADWPGGYTRTAEAPYTREALGAGLPAPDPRLAAIAAWRDSWVLEPGEPNFSDKGVAALHAILSDLIADRDARKEREGRVREAARVVEKSAGPLTRYSGINSFVTAWSALSALAAALAGGGE